MLPLRSLPAKPTRSPARWLAAVAALVAGCPLAAHALQPAVSQAPAVEVQNEWVPPQGDAPQVSSLTPGQGMEAAAAQRSTLWARRGMAAVGLGVQSPLPAGPSGYNALAPAASQAERASFAGSNLVVGMALVTSERSRLVVDTPLLPAPRLDDSLNPTANNREVRVGLQIKPADPLKSLRAGQLFKLELSTRSQLALKPRSGGVMMSYSAKF